MVWVMRNNTDRGDMAVSFRLEGRTVIRDGIGARVSVYLAGRDIHLMHTLRAGDGFISQPSKWQHFGLGTGAEILRIHVRRPGEPIESFTGITAGVRKRLVEGAGRARKDAPRAKPAWPRRPMRVPNLFPPAPPASLCRSN
jgi:hypothetical protein